MTLQPALVRLLRLAHSAERAAAYAYQGHAGSVRSQAEKDELKVIEDDEWQHRQAVLDIMKVYGIEVSGWWEFKYAVIGRVISASCYLIGWFLPMYFAGRLESYNVNEYFHMKRMFNEDGITKYDALMDEMAIKEKEHELYFLRKVEGHWMLPLFSFIFRWGPGRSFNDLGEDVADFNPQSEDDRVSA